MNLNPTNAYSNVQRLTFGSLKVDATETSELKKVMNLIFTTPTLKQAAADTFEKIDAESTKAGKDYIIDGIGPWEGDNGACIVVTNMDSVITEKVTEVCQDSDVAMCLEDVVVNKPSEEEVLAELKSFEEDVMHKIKTSKSVTEDFVDYKTVI